MFDVSTFEIAGIQFAPMKSEGYFEGRRPPYRLEIQVRADAVSLLVSEEGPRGGFVYHHYEYHQVESGDPLASFNSTAPAMAGALGQEYHETQEAALGALKAHAEAFFLDAIRGMSEWLTWQQSFSV